MVREEDKEREKRRHRKLSGETDQPWSTVGNHGLVCQCNQSHRRFVIK